MKQNNLVKQATKGLAGALAIAGGTTAYATPVSVAVPGNISVAPGGANATVNWDVNGDSVADFVFTYRYPNSAATGVVWQANMTGTTPATNGTVGYQGAFIRYTTALQSGFSIGPTLANSPGGGANSFATATQAVLGSQYRSGGIPTYYSGFAAGAGGAAHNAVAPGTPAFAGFRFNSGGQTFYGWVRLSVGPGSVTFVSAAYDNVANTPIAAGAVPEPTSIAMLALGAVGVAGVVAKKRRRS